MSVMSENAILLGTMILHMVSASLYAIVRSTISSIACCTEQCNGRWSRTRVSRLTLASKFRTIEVIEGSLIMQRDFLVESRSYDKVLRGSWRAYQLIDAILLVDETDTSVAGCLRLWLPAGTLMNWSTGTRPLKNHCLQLFWPQ